MSRRILIIVTSNARMGDTGKPTGLWAEELAAPYFAFVDAGFDVEIASPQGGAAPVDPGSLKPKGENDAVVERFLADEAAQRKVRATARVAEVDAAAFDAVFFPGGHGTMWDLPGDAGVTRAVESAYAAGKIVAAVCHGPAGLVSARRPDGQPLVAGKRVNAFTDDEEREAGQAETVPFLLESRLRNLGAKFEKTGNWQPFAVRDGQLITGQNPQSSAEVARLVLQALGEAD
nr:type 1 glutamine amidotransferase domain-containing protein [uncultured Caldimonas sp.]